MQERAGETLELQGLMLSFSCAPGGLNCLGTRVYRIYYLILLLFNDY